jgi:hypothetical protein
MGVRIRANKGHGVNGDVVANTEDAVNVTNALKSPDGAHSDEGVPAKPPN